MRRYTLEFEFEVHDDDAEDGLRVLQVEADVRVEPYDPGCISGPPERCYPPEGGEVEIYTVTIDGAEWKEADWPQGLAEEIERRATKRDEEYQQGKWE